MASKRSKWVRTGLKLLLVGGLAGVGIGLQVTGLPARTPSAEPASADDRPKPRPPVEKLLSAPAPRPVAATDDPFVVRRVLPIDGPMQHGDFVWDDAGVPAGPLVVTIDLAAQTLSVFRGGYEIGAAVILYGATDKPSPVGTFPISQKDADHVSNLYGAPMPYMLRLTNDGVAIHASDVKWGSATHGCIGVPTEFAKKLFAQARLGDRVIITDGKRLGVGQQIIQG